MEDPTPYQTPSYLETVQSQLPALQLLTAMGWGYLSPAQALELRGGRRSAVILEPILLDFIRRTARFTFKGEQRIFTENAIAEAIRRLKDLRVTGALSQNAEIYDLLTLPVAIEQTVEGDTKSFNIRYIDWKHPENNRFHCTAEFHVERLGRDDFYRADIVLFVNGIPLGVIECKRSSYPDLRKSPIDQAIDQLADYQKPGGIPQLFLYNQLVLALARDKAEYATTGTIRKFWTTWREAGRDTAIRELIDKPISPALLAAPFAQNASKFQTLHTNRELTVQDRTLYGLCRPARFLEMIFGYVLFDNGIKKIARYQQFFTVRDIIKRIHSAKPGEPRPGGVVWQTQGSGKSLTMVMLAKALALEDDIDSAKIILVTDRIDLDNQILDTFRACQQEVEQAATGADLVRLLNDGKAHIVTTLIHKFSNAAKSRELKQATHNTFVLVDEGHRSQYDSYHAQMKLSLRGACFIAFTGTPLIAKTRHNTFRQFGALFTPPYTIAKAVEDGAITPLLYEARHVPQTVDAGAIDGWFERLTQGLTPEQRADLKRKFASNEMLNKAEQKVKMIAWDITRHFVESFKGTDFKGQLVAPDRLTALLYQHYFEEFGEVSTQVLISGPNEREGEKNSPDLSRDTVKFWESMMARYGSEAKYNKLLINSFKNGEEPEIIIVVDKLLTGFDAPRNAVLYLARTLRGHTLPQAIARVNRLYEGKKHGLILDYSGVIENLDEAITLYKQLAEFDPQDVADTVRLLSQETDKLPQVHSALWDLFPGLKGSVDQEKFAHSLRDKKRRDTFYDRFNEFARSLALALSSTGFLAATPQEKIDLYKRDLKFFQNLRADASLRFQERVDFSEYEPKIRKLIDTHIGAEDVVQLCPPINLFDTEQRREMMQDSGMSAGAKADMIASATQRTIHQEMDKDPAFYAKFSKMIAKVLEDLYAGRISALEALPKLKDIANKVATHTDETLPEELTGHDMARRYFGAIQEDVTQYHFTDEAAAQIAIKIHKRVKKHKIRDYRDNIDALNRMRGEIDDILFELEDKKGTTMPVELHDKLIDKCIEITIANED